MRLFIKGVVLVEGWSSGEGSRGLLVSFPFPLLDGDANGSTPLSRFKRDEIESDVEGVFRGEIGRVEVRLRGSGSRLIGLKYGSRDPTVVSEGEARGKF